MTNRPLATAYPNDLWGEHNRRRARREAEMMRYHGTGYANPAPPQPTWECECKRKNPGAVLRCLGCGKRRT